jgi:hypothetical protein
MKKTFVFFIMILLLLFLTGCEKIQRSVEKALGMEEFPVSIRDVASEPEPIISEPEVIKLEPEEVPIVIIPEPEPEPETFLESIRPQRFDHTVIRIPINAGSFQRELIRLSRQEYGLDAPIARFAAQIHAESTWRDSAVSPVGAKGIAQFMPQTAEWMNELFPNLRQYSMYSSDWSIRALLHYNKWHGARVRVDEKNECTYWHGIMRSYNGGLGHWQRELAAAEDKNDWRSIQKQCGISSRRSEANCRENLNYPIKILHELEHGYLTAGWGSHSAVCFGR